MIDWAGSDGKGFADNSSVCFSSGKEVQMSLFFTLEELLL